MVNDIHTYLVAKSDEFSFYSSSAVDTKHLEQRSSALLLFSALTERVGGNVEKFLDCEALLDVAELIKGIEPSGSSSKTIRIVHLLMIAVTSIGSKLYPLLPTKIKTQIRKAVTSYLCSFVPKSTIESSEMKDLRVALQKYLKLADSDELLTEVKSTFETLDDLAGIIRLVSLLQISSIKEKISGTKSENLLKDLCEQSIEVGHINARLDVPCQAALDIFFELDIGVKELLETSMSVGHLF